MRYFLTILLGLLAATVSRATVSRAADNEILLQNGDIHIGAPSDWVILAHSPTGNRTVIAFQIFGNEAEVGTQSSTNLTISTFALKDPDSAQAYAAPLTKRTEEGATTRVYEIWSIREWKGEQDGTKYQIMDARTVNKTLNVGILVRLAWPLLANNPTDYEDKMNEVFKTMLDSITRKNPETP